MSLPAIDKCWFQSGKADEYLVVCRDGQIGIHEFCLYHSQFYYTQHKARQKYEDKGKGLD